MRVIIFCGGDDVRLGIEINDWLALSGVEVLHILQSESMTEGGWSLTITIFYKDTNA